MPSELGMKWGYIRAFCRCEEDGGDMPAVHGFKPQEYQGIPNILWVCSESRH